MAELEAVEPPTDSKWDDISGDGAVLKRVIVAGSSDSPPTSHSVVCVNYEGMLLDGSVFDNKNTFRFSLGSGEVIRAWDVAIATMHVGEIAMIRCHESVAYGDKGVPNLIPPLATLLFRIELVSFESRSSMSSTALKDIGNSLFLAKDLLGALQAYSQAIAVSSNETSYLIYSNRSMCNAAIGDHEAALSDAVQCVTLAPSWPKGWWRKASAEISLGRPLEAAKSIELGMEVEKAALVLANTDKPSEFSKLQKALESLPSLVSEAPSAAKKSTAKDFTIGDELGVGNFTRICLATKKSTGEIFALKLIQKSEVDRMKRRHPNIHNEVSMERRTLAKLRHPGVITLFSTFQDYYCLYFQMEFLSGGELWCKINEDGHMVGAYESLVRFWVAEIVSAVEYIHSQGIVHRDLKPENLLLTADGHIKVGAYPPISSSSLVVVSNLPIMKLAHRFRHGQRFGVHRLERARVCRSVASQISPFKSVPYIS